MYMNVNRLSSIGLEETGRGSRSPESIKVLFDECVDRQDSAVMNYPKHRNTFLFSMIKRKL